MINRGRTEHDIAPIDAKAIDSLGVHYSGIAIDSRKVQPGDLFLAYPGATSDGRHFIPKALAAGAVAVLWDDAGFSWDARWRAPNLAVRELRQQAGFIASRFFGEPSRHLWIAGITGTNGKTSCSHWIAQAMTRLGRPTAIIGTLGSGFPGALDAAATTTPDPVSLQRQLDALRRSGALAVAMEVSSHGLEQGRVNGVSFDAALFTNLSRDHLDYHGSMEKYGAAKARLFSWPQLRHAVINLDDEFGERLAARIERSRVNLIGYGLGKGEIAGHKLDLSTRGLKLEITTPWGAAEIAAPVLGGFNAHNLLGVTGVLAAAEIGIEQAATALGEIEAVRGRMQTLQSTDAPLVVIDYAHTPDALEKALQTLRDVLPAGGRLHCVFGCGGDRDPGKRPLMGEIATRLADRCVITSDNPRSENPRAIIDQIVSGAHPDYHIEVDRAAAIYDALAHAMRGDVVLIAGKGHETYQEIGGQRLTFDDALVAQELLGRLAGAPRHV